MVETAGNKNSTPPRWLRLVLLPYTIVGSLLLLPLGLGFLMAPMLADSGRTDFFLWTLIVGVMLAPIVLFASLVTAWIAYRAARYRVTIGALCAPLVWASLLFLTARVAGVVD